MAFLPFILPAIIGAAGSTLGGLFGSKASQGPQLTGLQKQLRDQLLTGASNEITNLPQDISGYFSNALYGNNANLTAQRNSLNRTLAARGLSGSPVATSSLANLNMQGATANQQLINQMPLLKMQLLQSALSNASDIFRGSMPAQQATSQLSPGAAIGSGLNAFTSIWQALKGQNAQQSYNSALNSPTNPLSTTISPDYGSILNTGINSWDPYSDPNSLNQSF